MIAAIIPYSNPDLDGVACAIALAELSGAPWTAHIVGDIDGETRAVLDGLGIRVPPAAGDWAGVELIWLVDTHHPNQLPADLPVERVVCITDHHPGGAPDRFPHATIQNESVGAAATLVVERFADQLERIPTAMAGLLQAAILSNTLDFMAPATSPRDHEAFRLLERIAPLSGDLVQAMSTARRSKLAKDTHAIVNADVKVFETLLGRIAVSQVETGGALDLLDRSDLFSSLSVLEEARRANSAVLNLVDLDRQASALLSTRLVVIERLAEALGLSPNACGIIHADCLLQRKTDIIPHLT